MMARVTVNEDMDHSDTEVSQAEHSKLLMAISHLDSGQRVKPPSRKEPSLQVSEFHLVQSGEGQGNAVHLLDLAKALKTRSNHVQIRRKLKAIRRKGRTLPKPLEKPVAERIRRSVGFKKVKKQVSRWEPIVLKNRIADHLSFPVSQGRILLDTSREFFTRFKTKSPLEAQVAEILSQSKCAQEDREKAEKEFPLSLEELAERRKEMARLRSQQSYEAAKARRQGKIKSNKYHRVLRRERLRKQLKDFETLQKTDPEAALEQLQLLERTRAKERMTLRHRNTGQWARSRAVRAKYDPQSRQALAEQLAISRDLTKKLQAGTDSSEEEAVEGEDAHLPAGENEMKSDNPWITAEPELQDFVVEYQQYWKKHNKELADKKKQSMECLKNGVVLHSKLSSVVNKELCLNETSSHPEGSQQDDVSSIEEGIVNHSRRCSEVEEESMEAGLLVVDKHSNNSVVSDTETKIQSTTLKAVISSSEKAEKISSSMKVGYELKNFSRKIKGLGPTAKNTCGEISSKPPVRRNVLDSSGRVETARVKGTSAWIVTSIKLAGDKKCDVQGKNEETLLQNVKINKKWRKAETDIKLENVMNNEKADYESNCYLLEDSKGSGIKTMKTDARKFVHMDDIFEDMNQKLKQKVSGKLSNLKNNILSNDNQDDIQAREVEDVDTDGPALEFKSKAKRPQEDVQLTEVPGWGNHSSTPGPLSVPVVPQVSAGGKEGSENQNDDVDPSNFLSVKPRLLQTQFPDMMTGGDEGLDDEENEENQQMTITEAFTGDDVVAEFVQEKADEKEKSKPKDIDLSLPGWGLWGGKNLPTNKRKKRRFLIKFPKVAPRRDDNKGHLIINEDKETKILQHQVSEVPFPFTTVKDFEASIRAPIGNTWVPETAHRKLIEPQVKTKLGAVIQAMDEETLVNKIKKVDDV